MRTTTKIKERQGEPKTVYKLVETYPDGQTFHRFPSTLAGEWEKIEYQSGPRRDESGRLIWKPCVHSWTNAGNRYLGYGKGTDTYDVKQEAYFYIHDSIALPMAGNWDSGVVTDCLDQLNLNCRNAVMAYSGVIQAIPLFGNIVKLNSILRKLARNMPRSFAKRPFTQTIRWAISADFIDRFVISPTIADAQMFHHACDYVINVLETMRTRNSAPFALKASRTEVTKEERNQFTMEVPWTGRMSGEVTRKSTITSEAFLFVSANYDEAAVSPIQLWMSRTGFTRPLESAWDMVPFSFVMDYFARAGDFIEGLSTELSSQEGLRAKIGEIHSLWGTCTTRTLHAYKPERIYATGSWRINSRAFSPESLSSGTFQRFPINQPGTFINLLGESSDNFIDIALSRTRVRTLAELIAQAKLPR